MAYIHFHIYAKLIREGFSIDTESELESTKKKYKKLQRMSPNQYNATRSEPGNDNIVMER